MTGRDGHPCEHDSEPGWVKLEPSERDMVLDAIDAYASDVERDLSENRLVMAMVVAAKVRAAGQ